MDLTADLLGPVWYWAALPVLGILLLHTAWRVQWRRLSDSARLNLFLGTVVALVMLWCIRAGIHPGLGFHLLGATACTLMFGSRLALIAMTLVMLGAAAAGALQWWSLPLNVLLMGAVPVAVSATPVVPNAFTNGLLLSSTAPSGDGAPRSQASESKSPNTWHDAHEASPFDEEKCESYRNRRPATIGAGSGLCTVR